MRIRLLLILAILIFAAPALAQNQSYPIRLERPYKPGDRFTLTFRVENLTTRRFTSLGAPPNVTEQLLKGEITGTVEVTQVDAGGNTTGLAITIKKFTTGRADDPALPENTILDVSRSASAATFTPRGDAKLTAEGRRVLAQIYTPQRKKPGGGDDAIMGSRNRRRRVGDSWPVRTEHVDPALLDADPKNVSSDMTFKGVESVNGTQAMRLIQSLKIKDFKAELPPEYILESSGVTMDITSIVPVDTTLPPIELSSKTDMHFTARHNTGGNRVEITQRIATTQIMQPLNP